MAPIISPKVFSSFIAFYDDNDKTIADVDITNFMDETDENHPSQAVLRTLADIPASALIIPFIDSNTEKMHFTTIHHVLSYRTSDNKTKFVGFKGFAGSQVPELCEVPRDALSRVVDRKTWVQTPTPNQLLSTTSEEEIDALNVTEDDRINILLVDLSTTPFADAPALYEGSRKTIAIPPSLVGPLENAEDPASAFVIMQEEINKAINACEEDDHIGRAHTLTTLIPILQLLWICSKGKSILQGTEKFTPIKSSQLIATTDKTALERATSIAFRFCGDLNGSTGTSSNETTDEDEDDIESTMKTTKDTDTTPSSNIKERMRLLETQRLQEAQLMRESLDRNADFMRDLLVIAKQVLQKQSTVAPTTVTVAAPRSATITPWKERLNPWHQFLITRASADVHTEDGTITPAEGPNPLFRDFLEKASKNAHSTVVHHLHSMMGCYITVDRNLSTTLHNMLLVPAKGSNKAGRGSVFYMYPANEAESALILSDTEFSIRTANGCLQDDQIKAATKSKIIVPTNILELLQQLRSYQIFLGYVFTNKSAPFSSIGHWIDELNNNITNYTKYAKEDPEFIIQIMVVIEDAMNLFLDSCTCSKKFADVNFEYLDFAQDFKDIKTRRFRIQIPAHFKDLLSNSKSKNAEPGSSQEPSKNPGSSKKRNSDNPANGNKKKHKAGEGDKLERNPNPVLAWKTPPGKLGHFTKDADAIPKRYSDHICVKWHLGGRCSFGPACDRALTHCQLEGSVFTAVDDWYKSLKATLPDSNGTKE